MQDRTTQYAADVLAGKIIAGDLVKLACKRHLDDIEKSKAAPYKYYFDVEQAERIIEFAETLTIAEGEEEEQVECYAFQCFILGNLNGWRTKTGGHRRFRTSYVQLGRQNGKSFLNGILAAYYGNFEKYKYGQIYCTATKKDQSSLGLKGLGSGVHRTQREADHTAHRDAACHVLDGLLHIAGVDADRSRVVGDGLVAQGLDLGPGSLRLEQGVIDVGQDLFTIHTFFLLNRSCFENSFLVLGGTAYLRHADSAQGNGRCRHRCADDAQHKAGDQKCKTFQTTFHNTVPRIIK